MMRTCLSSNRPLWRVPITDTSTPCSLSTQRMVSNFRSPDSKSGYSTWKGLPLTMPAQFDEPLAPELRNTLNNLAAALFGLDTWIGKPGKYKPPLPAEDMPWRAAGHKFSPAD